MTTQPKTLGRRVTRAAQGNAGKRGMSRGETIACKKKGLCIFKDEATLEWMTTNYILGG